MTQERVEGYVVGSDTIHDEQVWKVKVTTKGEYEGKKLRVASVRGNIALCPGLDVSFLIGAFQGRNWQEEIIRAVDVTLIQKIQAGSKNGVKTQKRDITMSNSQERIELTITEYQGTLQVSLTGFGSEEEATKYYQVAEDKLIDFLSIRVEDMDGKTAFHRIDTDSAFGIISALTVHDQTRAVLEVILQAAFQLGQRHPEKSGGKE